MFTPKNYPDMSNRFDSWLEAFRYCSTEHTSCHWQDRTIEHIAETETTRCYSREYGPKPDNFHKMLIGADGTIKYLLTDGTISYQ